MNVIVAARTRVELLKSDGKFGGEEENREKLFIFQGKGSGKESEAVK